LLKPINPLLKLRFIAILVVFQCMGVSSFAQKKIHEKFDFFFYWGYNRSAFNKSDVHISGNGYDLTFKDVEARDKPTPFSIVDYIKPDNISKPQYNYRMGLYLNDRLSISIGMDHMKYYMITDQNLQIEGYIDPSASEKYQGTYDNSSHEVPWRFMWLHHSDGLNYASVEVEYNYPIWQSMNEKFSWEGMANVGVGMVVPKTYVMILNEGVDNKFHIAGGGPSVKLGTRFSFFKFCYAEIASKNGYVWMPKILVNNDNSAQAKQRFAWTQFYGAVGFNIPLSGKQKNDAQNP